MSRKKTARNNLCTRRYSFVPHYIRWLYGSLPHRLFTPRLSITLLIAILYNMNAFASFNYILLIILFAICASKRANFFFPHLIFQLLFTHSRSSYDQGKLKKYKTDNVIINLFDI